MLLKVTIQKVLLCLSRCITEELGARNTLKHDLTDSFKLLIPKHGTRRLYLTGS